MSASLFFSHSHSVVVSFFIFSPLSILLSKFFLYILFTAIENYYYFSFALLYFVTFLIVILASSSSLPHICLSLSIFIYLSLVFSCLSLLLILTPISRFSYQLLPHLPPLLALSSSLSFIIRIWLKR